MELLTQFPDEYDANIQVQVFDGISSTPQGWRDYYNGELTPGQLKDHTAGYSGFGVLGEWKDGEDLPIDSPVDLYDNTITQSFYGMGFKVSRKHVEYGQLRIIKRWAQALSRSVTQLYSITHADVLNNAFTTTFSSLGDVALISASHTASGGQTRSNIVASSALTPANLETLIVQGMNAVNYRGLNDPITYNKIIIPPSLRRTAVKILASDKEMGTMDNDTNTQRGMFQIVIDPFLNGSTTHWFLQAPTHGLTSVHGKTPTPKRYIEEKSESLVHGVAADFAVGIEFFEGIAGSKGA